ncbi:DUF4232 domain-containing protein [Corynebacterium mendelii]|uniref:DUF4232 domain-containing protein n=1 Tax=Corynebacterium mendelii TaxID=2765362 RepID=A0A939E1P8_9CORY|nr:DUF4232 domain-containing protein [Corynebacterium mendelii]MBN9644820.1 DUF4232 domain-containing protein [Corynebacterium mendelii]
MDVIHRIVVHRLPVAVLVAAGVACISCSADQASVQSPASVTEYQTTSGTAPGVRETPQPAGGDAPTCRAGNIDGTIDSTQSGAGSVMRTVRLTNRGPACTMYGYPGVSVTDAGGNQLGAAAEREGALQPESVRLDTGQSAHFHMRMSNARIFDPTVCQPVDTVAFIKIYPPNDTGSLSLPATGAACADPSTPFLFTGAVNPG